MQSMWRYCFIFLLFFCMISSLHAAESVQHPSLEKIEINDQTLPYALPPSKKDRIKRYSKICLRYLAVPSLIALSMGNRGIKSTILQGLAAAISFHHAYEWVLFNRKQNKLCDLDELPIPNSLQSEDVIIKQIRSYRQRGGSCGWYVLFNAMAIAELVEQHQEITAPAIADIIRTKWIPYVTDHKEILAKIIDMPLLFDGLNGPQTIELAEHIGLHNYYVLSIDERGTVFFNGPARKIGDVELKEKTCYQIFNLQEAVAIFKQDKAPVKHILLSAPFKVDGNHAVLLTFINRPNEKPMIIYMDSNNVLLEQCWLDYVTPFFVYKIINYLVA